jgi:hypothetical protein
MEIKALMGIKDQQETKARSDLRDHEDLKDL